MNSLKFVRAFQIELELIWKCWFFKKSGKTEYREKNLSKQGREPTTISTHRWSRRKDWNSGDMGGRRVASALITATLLLLTLVHD